MFGYILAVSWGLFYVNVQSNIKNTKILYPLLLAILAILFKNYFKGQKIWWLLLNCTKIPQIVLCWKY